MDIFNLIIATASLVVAAIGSIYIPLYLHREAQKQKRERKGHDQL